jgi:hypothetical protein
MLDQLSAEIMPSLIKGVTTTTKQNVNPAVYYVYSRVKSRNVCFSDVIFAIFADEPEIHVDKAWIHADVSVEVEISCIVHAEPSAEVSNDSVTNVKCFFPFSVRP